MKRIRIPFEKVNTWKQYKKALDKGHQMVRKGTPYDVVELTYDANRDDVVVSLVPHYDDSADPGPMDSPIEGM